MQSCVECGCSEVDVMANIRLCADCGLELPLSVCDIQEQHVHSRSSHNVPYSRLTHFKRCIDKFEGSQNKKLNLDWVKKALRRLGIVSSAATKKQIQFVLRDAKRNDLYADINLIHAILVGVTVQLLSYQLREQLVMDFTLFNRAYDDMFYQISASRKKNFLINNYILFQLLRKNGYRVEKADMNGCLLKTADKQSNHEHICESIFNKLGWRFSSVF
jgi:hypothetical protein